MRDFEYQFWTSLLPRRKMEPSEWCEFAPRIIPDNGINPEPGPWRNDRAPYLAGVMDAINSPDVREVVFVKPTQVGFTEVLQNVMMFWIDTSPGAAMIVMPDEKSARSVLEERYVPTIRATPATATRLSARPWDTKKQSIKLDNMPIYVAWAGSPMALASRAIRYLMLDEVDKYPPFSGREADPISLAIKRVSNWKDRYKIITGSSPTVRSGNVLQRWEMCADRRHFHVQCPRCLTYQTLSWSMCKWPKIDEPNRAKRADRVRTGKLAYIECASCGFEIRDEHKPAMLVSGKWVGEHQEIDEHGVIKGDKLNASRVGFHINSLYSPWVDISDMAAEFIEAQGDKARMMDFRNSRLAEPFEEQVQAPRRKVFEQKLRQAVANKWLEGNVPRWAGVLMSAVDTQIDHFKVTIRAWGNGNKSRLILFATVKTFEELTQVALESKFPVEGEPGAFMSPRQMLIDSGGTRTDDMESSRTQEVYQYALSDPRIIPIKGASNPQAVPIKVTTVTPRRLDGTIDDVKVVLRLIDTNWYKDILAKDINEQDDRWQLSTTANDEYVAGMAVEHKIYDRKAKGFRWHAIDVAAARRNHPWDTEVYQYAGADIVAASTLPDEEALVSARAAELEAQKATRRSDDRRPDQRRRENGWLNSYKRR